MVERTKDLLADARQDDTVIHAPILQKPETPTTALFKDWDREVMEAKQHSQQEDVHNNQQHLGQQHIEELHVKQHQHHTQQHEIHHHKPVYESLEAFEKQQELIRKAIKEKQTEDLGPKEVIKEKIENLKEEVSTRVENTIETLAHQKEQRGSLFSDFVDSVLIVIDTLTHPFGYMWEGMEDFSREYKTKHAWSLK